VGAFSAWFFYTYAAPHGSENDLSWVGPGITASRLPAWVQRFVTSKYVGKSTGFPDWLNVGNGRKITTRFPAPKSTLPLWQLQLIVASATAVAEGFDVYGLDDNLILPVISGLLIWGALYAFG
jgi:hypothetical protein